MLQSKNLNRWHSVKKSVFPEEMRKCHVLEATGTTKVKDDAHSVQVRLIQSFYWEIGPKGPKPLPWATKLLTTFPTK